MADQKNVQQTCLMHHIHQLYCYANQCQLHKYYLKYCLYVNTPTQTQLVLNYDESDVFTTFLVA